MPQLEPFQCHLCDQQHQVLYGTILTTLSTTHLSSNAQQYDEDMIVDPPYVYLRGSITLSITDRDQSLAFIVWIKAHRQDLVSYRTAMDSDRPHPLACQLASHPVLYPNASKVACHIDYFSDEAPPRLQLVESEATTDELTTDQKNGITFARLSQLFGRLIHQSNQHFASRIYDFDELEVLMQHYSEDSAKQFINVAIDGAVTFQIIPPEWVTPSDDRQPTGWCIHIAIDLSVDPDVPPCKKADLQNHGYTTTTADGIRNYHLIIESSTNRLGEEIKWLNDTLYQAALNELTFTLE